MNRGRWTVLVLSALALIGGPGATVAGTTAAGATVAGAKAPTELWSARYNHTSNLEDIAGELLLDPWGDVVVGGTSEHFPYFPDMVVIKYDRHGVEKWRSRWDGASILRDDDLRALAIDPSGYILAAGSAGSVSGSGEYDLVVLRYDRNGVLQWQRYYNGPYSEWDGAFDVAVDQAGNVYATGYSESRLGEWDYITLKYDAQGAYQWEARYDGPAHLTDMARQVLVDDAGNVYVFGESQNESQNGELLFLQYDSDGVEQWSVRRTDKDGKSIDFYEAALDPAGFIYITGSVRISGDMACMLLKYNTAGEFIWDAYYDDDDSDVGKVLTLDEEGNIYVAGETWSGENWDLLTLKFNDAGVEQWAEIYNGPGDWVDYGNDLAVDGNGNVYVIAESDGGSTLYDYAIVKYDNDGGFQWDFRYDGPAHGDDFPYMIAADEYGAVYVTGGSTGSDTGQDFLTLKVGEGDDDDDDDDDNDNDTAGEPFVEVAMPTHGTVWNEGDSETIAWDMNNPFGWNIRASLYKAGVYEGRRLCDNLPAGATSCQYTVESDIVADNDYAVQVYFIGHGVPYQDFSPEFTINSSGGDDDDDDDTIPAAAIEVTAPGAGDVWNAGSTQTITWTMENPEAWMIQINLFKNNYYLRSLCEDLTAERTSCQYTVAADLITGDDYTVQAFFVGHGSLFHDFSPAFTINGQPDDDDDNNDNNNDNDDETPDDDSPDDDDDDLTPDDDDDDNDDQTPDDDDDDNDDQTDDDLDDDDVSPNEDDDESDDNDDDDGGGGCSC